MEKENIITLDLKAENVCYQMYVPFYKTDFIQGYVSKQKEPYEYEMLQAMLLRIPKDSFVLDIGMNIANHSLFLAANGLNILAFEANPKMSEIAKKSIALNGFENKIQVNEFGLSDCEEIMHFAKEIPSNFGGMSLSKGESTGEEGILCKTLDSLKIQEKISCIKIDVEGMESRVLKGARELIMKNRPIIYAEANYVQDFVKLERVLETMDYVHWDTFGGSPTHLYLPLESVSEKQILAKNAAKIALQGLYYTGYRHRNWITNILEKIDKETAKHTIALESISKQNHQRIFQERITHLESILFGTATTRIQNHLNYQLGQILIQDSKSLFGISKLPFKILLTILKHKNKQKQYQTNIKNNPHLKLPPLESYPDYKESLKIKNYFSYKLGEAFLTSISAGEGGFLLLYAKRVS